MPERQVDKRGQNWSILFQNELKIQNVKIQKEMKKKRFKRKCQILAIGKEDLAWIGGVLMKKNKTKKILKTVMPIFFSEI